MKLWKIYAQKEQEYIDLMNQEFISYDSSYNSFCEENDTWLRPVYQWLVQQFKVPNTGNYEFPFHAFYQVEGSTDPLNNKYFGIHSPGDYIVVEFDIDKKNILLYDDDLFIICLNHGYLSLTEAEDRQFDNYIKFFPQLGIDIKKLIMDKNYIYTLTRSQQNLAHTYLDKLYTSWRRIFNLNIQPNSWVGFANKTILGIVWTLSKEQISNTINFSVSESELNAYYGK